MTHAKPLTYADVLLTSLVLVAAGESALARRGWPTPARALVVLPALALAPAVAALLLLFARPT